MRERLRAALWVVWASARLQAREIRSDHLAFVIALVQPVTLALIMMGTDQDPDQTTALRWSVGIVLTSLWASTVWVAGNVLRRETRYGTLAAVVTGSVPGFLVLLGKCLGGLLRTTFVTLPSVAVTVLVIGPPLTVRQPVWLAVTVVLTLATGTSLGMLISCAMLMTRHGPQVSAALMYPVFILGGMLIPIDYLPTPLQWLSALISLRWAQEFATAAAAGDVRFGPFGVLVLLTAAYFAIARWTLSRVVDRARGKGTLELL